MKILFYGNCQTQVAMSAVALSNPTVQVDYAGNSRRVAKFDPERTERLFDWCDHIVTQPVMNTDNPDDHEVLRGRFGDKVIFMPYVWVDGLFSLVAAPGGKERRGDSGFLGDVHVTEHLRRTDLAQTIQDYQDGRLDFQHAERFEASMTELARREAFTDVKVAPFIRDHYRDRTMMLTHNHPHPEVINEIARQIAARLGLSYQPVTMADPLPYEMITLPEFGKILSPYGVRDLGLRYGYDLQWLRVGRDMITQIAEGLDTAAGTEARAENVEREARRAERQAARREQKRARH